VSNKRRASTRTKRPRTVARSAADVPVGLLIATAEKALRVNDAERAEVALRRALATDPTEPRVVQLIGTILVGKNEIDEALDLFEAALDRAGPPSTATMGFHNNYANTLRLAQRYVASEKLLRELVELAPGEWQPWHNFALALRDMERYDEAAAAIRRAIVLAPEFGPNHGVLGEVLLHLGRLHSARAALARCVDLGWKEDSNLWTTIGAVERQLGCLDTAHEALARSLALSGDTPGAHSNLAIVLVQLGRFDEAIPHFERSVELAPDDALMHAHLGYGRLAGGDLGPGWDEWEWGLKGGPRGYERAVGVPRWTPDDRDSRVLVYREQGVGDEIMFASCLPDIIDSAREVVVECDARVTALFARSFPNAEVRPRSLDLRGGETMHDFDRAVPIGSLPLLFRRTLGAFPDRRGYLVADPEKVAAWRERLAEAGPGPYVGLSWRSRVQTAERRLEYTRLEEWKDLFGVPGVTWVNLQYDKCERELHDAEQLFGVQIHRWAWLDLMNDFDEIAALTTALDLVVAPRNAVAMLSGALGVDTIALANRHAWADLGTDHLPWLPSVRLVCRMPNEEWDTVLATAGNAVAEVAARAGSKV
jgi:tetratricopeptide (TPR) repeat protein